MSHRHTALTLTWIVVFGVALTGDGIVVGSSKLMLVGAAIAIPGFGLIRLVRRSLRQRHVRGLTTSRTSALPLEVQARSTAADAMGVGLSAWENEGGAPQTA